jgi:hypothetical protein
MSWTGFIWLSIRRDEDGNKPSGSTQCLENLDLSMICQLVVKDAAQWSQSF